MPSSKKDSMDSRSGGGNSGRVQNGTRTGFRTDTSISNSRHGNERVLERWDPGPDNTFSEGLEKSSTSGRWDQFAANEKLFGLRTDYDENMYTTAIDKSHPRYRERMAAADRKAKEIERSTAATSHVAEERVMDYTGGGDDQNGDEEEKYSGVRRQEHLTGRENKYTPPAKRAPTGQATISGAPIDPAIISSQLKATQPKKNVPTSGTDKSTSSRPEQLKTESKQKGEKSQKSADVKSQDAGISETKTGDSKTSEKSTPLRSPAATGGSTPSATATVERDVLNSFKNFAAVQRSNAEKARIGKAKADKEVKLTELKFFANTFKLSTPVPNDLIGIIAKDPSKQKEIQARAMQNAEEVQKAKDAAKLKDVQSKETQAKPSTESQTPTPASDPKPQASRPQAPHTSSHPNMSNRHGGNRQSYGPSYNAQQFPRGDRSGQQQSQGRPTGNLAQRLRNVEHHKASQPPHAPGQLDARLPPTAPANGGDGSFSRRPSGTPGHMNKLNPNTQEFRPNAFAPAFNPAAQPSTTSSPRSAITNQAPEPPPAPALKPAVRRKTKPVDCKKCSILAHVKTVKPPQGRNWDDNGGLRPTYDTAPTWRQLPDKEDESSTMNVTYKQYFERNPFAGPAGTLTTPNPAPVLPHMAHQHQLPFHLQQGAHMAPRPSPHMPPMQMHGPPHSHSQHMGYANTDDHRMVHSNSSQSFASPRMSQAPVYPPMSSPGQAPYGQPVMQPFSSNAPHMGQYRSFSNNPQYMPQQQGHMGGPMMMQPQYMSGPQGMLMTPPQMQMYPSSQGQFMPPGSVAVPPQQMAASNGYPSPGRPTAAPMAHQGSAQGQQVYGMSPSMPYQQPAYGAQAPGHMNNGRGGYGSPAGPQQYGSSPQQFHPYGAQHRSGSNNFGNKNFTPHGGQHQMGHNQGAPSGPQGRAPDGPDEAK